MRQDPKDQVIADLRAALALALADLGELKENYARLVEQSAKMSEQLAELMAILSRKAARVPKVPAPAAPADLDDAARAAYDGRPAVPALPERPKPAKQPQRPTGRKPLPDHLPVDEHVLRPEVCEHCGKAVLDLVDEVVEEKLDLIKEHFRRRRVRRKTCRCRFCLKRTTATSLPAPYERSKVTSSFLAWVVMMKFVMLAPIDRIRRELASRGIPLAMSTLVSLIERAADLLGPVDGHHWKQLLAGTWMASDASGLKVIVPGLKGTHNGYLEVFRRDDLVVLQYEASKAAEALVSKLKPFRGTLVVDAEHRYNPVFVDGCIIEAGCNAHGRRKFEAAETIHPTLGAEGGAFIAALYAVENRARELGLTGDALRDERQRHMRPIKADFERWLAAVSPTLTPSDPLGEAVRYYLKHGEALFRFIDHPELPIDNSPCEREFQNVAKLRLNVLFAGSSEGAHRAATLLGVVATCRAVGVSAFEYLAWAFDRLGTHREIFGLNVAELTPAAFKKTLAET